MKAKQIIASLFILIFISSFQIIPIQLVDDYKGFIASMDMDQDIETEEKSKAEAVEEMLSSISNHVFGFDNFAFASHHVNMLVYFTHLKLPDIPPEVSSFS